jgi:hypothetical protein
MCKTTISFLFDVDICVSEFVCADQERGLMRNELSQHCDSESDLHKFAFCKFTRQMR